MICLWTPETVLDFAKTVADSPTFSNFGAILSGAVFDVFVICLRKPKSRKIKKQQSRLRNSKQDKKVSKVAVIRLLCTHFGLALCCCFSIFFFSVF